jgi:hypothetical protein
MSNQEVVNFVEAFRRHSRRNVEGGSRGPVNVRHNLGDFNQYRPSPLRRGPVSLARTG